MTDETFDSSKSLFENSIIQAMDNTLVEGEIHIPSNKTRDYSLFKDPNDYNRINNAYLNKNINPYIINYKTWQSLGNAAARTKDANAIGRIDFENYDYDNIVDSIDSAYDESVSFALRQSENIKLDDESKEWWKTRHKYIKDKYNSDKREALLYQGGSWLGQVDNILSDGLEFAGEGGMNSVAAIGEILTNYGPRFANHLSINLAENAFNMLFFPADYQEQKRVNLLPEEDKKFLLDIMPGEGVFNVPSSAGFDGSINDYIGKNWGKGAGAFFDKFREINEARYTSRLMGNGDIRGGAELTRDLFALGKFGKGAKIIDGSGVVNNPKKLAEFEKIWKRTYQELKRDGGMIKGTYKYLKGRRVKNNITFGENTVKGRALRKRYDMTTNAIAWGFGAEDYIFDGKYSSIPISTKGLPFFEYDTPLGLVMAPILATAGTAVVRGTVGQIPASYAHFQMNQIARGFKVGTREYGLGFIGPKMDMQTASSRYLLRSGRVTPDQINSIDKGINAFDMKGKERPTYDASRGVAFKAEDYLFTEWMSGRLQDKRRVEATYKSPTDRQAINSFNTKMDLLNLDKSTAKAQNDMFIVYDKMAKDGSKLARNTLEFTSTAIQTQDRIMDALLTPKGEIRPRYKGIIEPSLIGPLYSQFDTYTNLAQASAYRILITEAGDLGPFGNRVDTILLNDLEVMANQEQNALMAHSNILSAIVKTINQNEAVVGRALPPEDPLKLFLTGTQEAIQKQQEDFTKHKLNLQEKAAQLDAVTDAGIDFNLSSINSKLEKVNIEKPQSLIAYENNFNSLTSKRGPDQDSYVALGKEARAIADKRHEDIYGEEGIIAQAYDVTRTKIDKTNQEFPSLEFTQVGDETLRGFLYEAQGFATDRTHVIRGNDSLGYEIGRYGGDDGFTRLEGVFPDRFAALEDAKLEVQSFENNAFRKQNPSETITVPKPLQETLNSLQIESGVNVFTQENGKNVLEFSGVSEQGTQTKQHIIRALKESGILTKYGGSQDPSYIPPKVNVDDLIKARSVIIKRIWKDGVSARAEGLGEVADTITGVLNKIPGYQQANETFQAYAKIWKNDYGAQLTEKQPGGNNVVSDFNLMESFIKYGIEEPTLAAANAFSYFGPAYKEMIGSGFAYGIENNRFTETELLKAKPFLKEIFNYNLQVNSRGEVIKDLIGRDMEKIKGKGGEIQALIDTKGILRTELALDKKTIIAKKEKAMQDSEAAQIQLDKVMFALSKGEERVVPFMKDFAGKSVSAMNVTVQALTDNSKLTMAQIKDGLLTGFKELLIADLITGSELSMTPALKGEKPTLKREPKENVAVIEGQKIPTPGVALDTQVDPKTKKVKVTEPTVEEGAGEPLKIFGEGGAFGAALEGDMTRLELGIPKVLGGTGVFNQKGYVTFQDENIIKQLNSKELEWTDVLKGWNTALNNSLTENGRLIEFLTTGEGAVTYLSQDVSLLKDLADTNKNVLNENLTLAKNPSRRPINIPRKWTSAQITGWTNSYMKRITSRTYALGYATFQGIKMRNARFQVRMLTDPAVRESLQLVFRGKSSILGFQEKQSIMGMLVYLLPTVAELYPEETDEQKLEEYENLRKEVIIDMLKDIGLGQKKKREDSLKDQMGSLDLN